VGAGVDGRAGSRGEAVEGAGATGLGFDVGSFVAGVTAFGFAVGCFAIGGFVGLEAGPAAGTVSDGGSFDTP
jgi:hypothetical protein